MKIVPDFALQDLFKLLFHIKDFGLYFCESGDEHF